MGPSLGQRFGAVAAWGGRVEANHLDSSLANLGGPWDLVTTYTWDDNPTYNWNWGNSI